MRIIILSILMSACTMVIAQSVPEKTSDSTQVRVVLIGDAGSLYPDKPSVVGSVHKYYPLDDKTVIVYLGDNLYDYGLPDETYYRYNDIKLALDSQINLVKNSGARGYMIPGNHDWANGASYGYYNILRQQQYVDRYSGSNMFFMPQGGCPGPVKVDLSENVVLVAVDSQWWLHEYEKPGIESDCDHKTEEEVIDEIKDILLKNFDKLVIFATHHPFKTNGPHGGYYTFKQHLFPFTELNKNLYIPMPVIGSIYPITRSVFGNIQDNRHPTYAYMISKMMEAIKVHPNVIMVSGHEHSLQYIKDSSYNYIVSGSGCKTTRVSEGNNTQFAEQALGYAVLDVSKNKNVDVSFYTIKSKEDDSLRLAFREHMLDFSKLPPIEKEDTVLPEFVYKNLAVSAASNQYKDPTRMQQFMNGNNYRKEWGEPVELPVFNIKKEKGGLKITGIGGGNQTKSLKMEDKDGNKWSLRTVDKDPTKAMPANIRNTFASDIVQDMISAGHPYAPLAITDISKSVGILENKRVYFYVPDDPALGYYRPLFANKVCMLEPQDPNMNDESKSTYKVFEEITGDNDHTIDQYDVLRARLVDMLIGDWDRHFDQWRWGTQDTGKGKNYYPMPKDRDQAFFDSDGWLVKLVKGKLPQVRGFKSDLGSLKDLNFVARDFDRTFLTGIDRSHWDSISAVVVAGLTDSVLENAVKKMPPEIFAIRGNEIIAKLKSRRDQLREASLKYYDYIAESVNVIGSNESESYNVTQEPDGKVRVTSFAVEREEGDSSFIRYQRVFDPAETREIVIYGFNGADRFIIDSTVDTDIRFRMVGGKGADTFVLRGSGRRPHIYDVTTEKNSYSSTHGVRSHFSADPDVNAFRLKSFNYNESSFPRINLGYNVDDGVLAGAGFLFRNYKFRRQPYANEHKLSTLWSFTKGGFQAKYSGMFYQLLDRIDVFVFTRLNNPGVNRFYGLGNETQLEQDNDFYLARFKNLEVDVMFNRARKDRLLNTFIGPSFYHYWNRNINNEGLVLEKPSLIGLDSAQVYLKQTFVGFKAGIDINNLNSDIFPTSGINWLTLFTTHKGVTGTDNLMTKLESNMVVYASLKNPARVVGVIKLGGGKIFSDSTQYFQMLNLGQNNVLRGFRRNRFSGDALAYGSLELRIKLLEGRSYAMPGQVGIIAFNDVGRVWLKGEDSRRWHNSFGGGLYYVPFNTAILSATVGRSTEGVVFNVSLGTKFNLTF